MKEDLSKTKSYLEKKKWKIKSTSFDDKGYSILFLADNEKEFKIRIEVEKMIFNGETITFPSHTMASYHRKISSLVKKAGGIAESVKPEAKKTKKTKSTPILGQDSVTDTTLQVTGDRIKMLVDHSQERDDFINISPLIKKYLL